MKQLAWRAARDLKILKFLNRYEKTKLKKVYGVDKWIRVKTVVI